MNMVNRGKKMVIILIVTILLIDIITVALVSSIYAVNGSAGLASLKLQQGIFRFVLTVLLMFFLYKGHSWAKWLSIVLLGLGGLTSLLFLVSSFNVILLVMGLVYTFFCVLLIASGSVNNFLQYQRGEFTPDSVKVTCIEDSDWDNTQK